MSEENVYLKPSPVDSIRIKDSVENIKVKDNMQLVKLQGPKGDPGPKGEPGKDGKPFTYDMFTAAQLAALKGPKGDPGPPGTGGSVDLSAYPTKEYCDTTFATKTNLSDYVKTAALNNYYVSKLFAENTYATKASLSDYMKTAAASNTFVSRIFADNTYSKKTDLNSYMTTAAIKDTFVSRIYADNNYAARANLSDYVKKSEISQYTSRIPAETAYRTLLSGNVWCESANVDDVLTALISNIGKPFPRTEFKPLTIPSVIQGQQVVAVTGEPHYSVKVVGNDTPFTLDSTGACTLNIPPLGEDNIKLTYHNFTGAKVGDYTIAGVQTSTPADDTIEVNGSVYKLYGDVLKINVTQNTTRDDEGVKFEFIPSQWRNKTINTIQLKSNRVVNLYTGRTNALRYEVIKPNSIPIYVDDPHMINFHSNDNSVYPTLNIGTLTTGTMQTTYKTTRLSWSDTEHRYLDDGDYADHL